MFFPPPDSRNVCNGTIQTGPNFICLSHSVSLYRRLIKIKLHNICCLVPPPAVNVTLHPSVWFPPPPEGNISLCSCETLCQVQQHLPTSLKVNGLILGSFIPEFLSTFLWGPSRSFAVLEVSQGSLKEFWGICSRGAFRLNEHFSEFLGSWNCFKVHGFKVVLERF